MVKRSTPLLIALLAALILSACGPHVSLSSVVNVARIKTTLNADGSGHNTFWLVVPVSGDCELVNLKPSLENLTSPTRPSITAYQDNQVRGFMVVYEFQNPDQIPVQIENIKRAVINAAIEATPTPIATSETPQPTPVAVGVYYNPNHLSITVEKPAEQLSGQAWKIEVNINPFLLTGLITEEILRSGLSEFCSLPSFAYELNVSSGMKIKDFQVETKPSLVAFSQITKKTSSSIEWSIESRQAFEAVKSDFESLMVKTPPPTEKEVEEMLGYLYSGPVYRLDVTATTPNTLFQILTRVVAPLVGLAATVLGIILTISKLRRKQKD